jgi:DNA-binding IclR family transcriptional regulator
MTATAPDPGHARRNMRRQRAARPGVGDTADRGEACTVDSGRASAQRQNQSVHKAAALLWAAAQTGSGATVSALARAAGLPRATALRMVEALVSERLLARLPDDRIVIGPGLHTIARATNLSGLVLDAAGGPMEELAGRTRESITLTIALPDGSLSVLRQIDGPHMIGLANWVGRPFPMHASSAGKLALACGPPERVDALLASGLPRLARRTITDPDAFRAELHRVRGQGWSQTEDELEDGLSSVSAGIAFRGGLVGSINISGPTTRFDARGRQDVLPSLTRACRLAAANLAGGHDDG